MPNTIKCIDCLHYKTRVIAKGKLKDDEFADVAKMSKQFNKFYNKVRILYCYYERKPYLDQIKGQERLVDTCKHVEGFKDEIL